jgi:hypothetical protein
MNAKKMKELFLKEEKIREEITEIIQKKIPQKHLEKLYSLIHELTEIERIIIERGINDLKENNQIEKKEIDNLICICNGDVYKYANIISMKLDLFGKVHIRTIDRYKFSTEMLISIVFNDRKISKWKKVKSIIYGKYGKINEWECLVENE